MTPVLTEKQKREKKICEHFIETAKKELGAFHTFEFLRCEDEGKDPPDCWVKYKGMNVGVELFGLYSPQYEERFKFCREVAVELNKMGVRPIGISPTLERKGLNHHSVVKAASKIFEFLTLNPNLQENFDLVIEEFTQFDSELAKQIHLQKPHPYSGEVVCLELYGYTLEEQIRFFIEKITKKLERIKKDDYKTKPDRIVILLHFDGTHKGGSFDSIDWETLLVCFKKNLENIDPHRLIYRCYITSEQQFRLFGHYVKVALVY